MADFNNIENFVNAFVSNGSPYFVLAIGSNIKFRNPKSNEVFELDEAAQILKQFLENYQEHENNHKEVFCLYIFDEKPKTKVIFNTAKKEADIVITFQFPKTAEYYQQKQNYVSPANAEILSELKALRMKVEEIEEVEEEEAPSLIGALTSNPQLMNTLVTAAMGMIAGVLNKFTPNQNQPMQKNINPAIAGVEEPSEEEKINKAIEVLSKSDKDLGNHLLILAKMSIDNPSQFHWLLNMLK